MKIGIKEMLSNLGEGGQAIKKTTVPYYWKGGTKNAETDWGQPMNWYNRQVPGWYDEVIISGEHTFQEFFPYINEFANDIAQLVVEKDGRFFLGQQGKLSIDGLGKKGLGLLNEGEIFIQGELNIHRTNFASIKNKGLIYNTGSIAIDKTSEKGILKAKNARFENFGELLFL